LNDESIINQFSEKKLFDRFHDMYVVIPDRAIMAGVTIKPELNHITAKKSVGRDSSMRPCRTLALVNAANERIRQRTGEKLHKQVCNLNKTNIFSLVVYSKSLSGSLLGTSFHEGDFGVWVTCNWRFADVNAACKPPRAPYDE
jgi:hypothetical protein